jgi:CHAT domain-containing protein/Tfp pilus assembly protein PilF
MRNRTNIIFVFILFLFISTFCQINVSADKSFQIDNRIHNPSIDTRSISICQKYINCADNYEVAAQYDSALFYYSKAKEVFKNLAQYDDYIQCLIKISKIYLYQYNFIQEINCVESALELSQNNVNIDSSQIADCYHLLGAASLENNIFSDAKKYFDIALKIRISLYGKNHIRTIVAYNDLGRYFLSLGKWDEAYQVLNSALFIVTKYPNQQLPDFAQTYNNLGLVMRNKGDYDKAIELYDMAIKTALKIYGEQNPIIASTYYNIAQVFNAKGDYHQALFYHKKALKIRTLIFHEIHPQIAESLIGIGTIYLKKGNLDLALVFFQKALPSLVRCYGTNHGSVAFCKTSIANVYIAKNEPDKALQELSDKENPLNIRLKTFGEQHPTIADTYQLLGRCYTQKQEFPLALKYLTKSLEIRFHIFGEKHPTISACYRNLGCVYEKVKKYDDALNCFNNAIIANCVSAVGENLDNYKNPISVNLYSEVELLNSFKSKAQLLHKMSHLNIDKTNNLIASFNTYKKLAELFDRMRASYKTEGSKLFLAEEAVTVYDQAINVSLELYEMTEDEHYKVWAFTFAEKSKAGILLESLTDSQAKQFSKIPDSLIQKEKKIRQELAFYDIKLQEQSLRISKRDSTRLFPYDDKYFSLITAYQSLLNNIEKDFPKYFSLKYQTVTTTPTEIQNILNCKSALVTYFIGDSTLYTYVITKTDYYIHSQPIDSSFYHRMRNLHQVIQMQTVVKSKIRTQLLKDSYFLYDILVKPIESDIVSVEKLIIVPDPQLTYIPFEALMRPSKNQSTDLAQVDYLIKRFIISYHYSATLYIKGQKDQNLNRNISFAGFAPVFDENIGNGVVKGENRARLDTLKRQFSSRAFITEQGRFATLPESEKEIKSIVDTFRHHHYHADQFLHKDATEQNLKMAKKYHIIHVATHGVFNEEKPQLSGLVFSQPFELSNDDDGFLYAGEVYNLDLESDLIVLSSCESGAGKVIRGEGIFALTRGFLYIGIPNIVFSLWKVTDKYTSRLMIQFYIDLLSGRPYAEALRNAKLKLIDDKTSSLPSYWSSFLYIGN